MATYTEAIQEAIEAIIQIVGNTELHIASEKWKAYEHNADIRENEGQTRLFCLELRKHPEVITFGSDIEDTDTVVNIVIGYDYGPKYDMAAQADMLAISHRLNNPTEIPEGIAYYLCDLSTDVPNWENIEGFRWVNLPVIIKASTTTE